MADTPEELEQRKNAFLDIGNALAEAIAEGKSLEEVFSGLDKTTEGLANALMLVPGAAGKTMVSIAGLNAESALLKGGFQELFTSLGATGMAMQGFAKMLDLVTRPTTELANNQFTAATSFNAATSAAGAFDRQIFQSLFNLRQFGVDGKEFDAVLQAMYGTFTELGIDGISPTEQRLVELAAIMAEVGIPTEKSTAMMQGLNKVFGQTNEDIEKTILGFDAFAEAIGMSAADVVSNFVGQMPYFALFGDEGERTFRRVQTAAKASGIETQNMLNVAKGFDTFEGAAKQVQSLNALLGGPYLSTMDMVRETDPTKRMMMLQDAFRASGKSVEDMGYYSRLAFPAMMEGLEGADDFVKFMNADFEKMSELIGVAGGSAEDMAEEVKKGMMPADQATILGQTALSLEKFGTELLDINEIAFSDTLEGAEELRANLETLAGPILDKVSGAIKDKLEDPLALNTQELVRLLQGAGVDVGEVGGAMAGAVAERGIREAQEIIVRIGDSDFIGYIEGIFPKVFERTR
jgi:hypothetical protein